MYYIKNVKMKQLKSHVNVIIVNEFMNVIVIM